MWLTTETVYLQHRSMFCVRLALAVSNSQCETGAILIATTVTDLNKRGIYVVSLNRTSRRRAQH
jgi:hypothetical protein